jgi:hypothetical protein
MPPSIYGYPRVSIHRHSVEAHVRQLREPLLSKRYSTKWRAEPSLAGHSLTGCSPGDPGMIIRRRPERPAAMRGIERRRERAQVRGV